MTSTTVATSLVPKSSGILISERTYSSADKATVDTLTSKILDLLGSVEIKENKELAKALQEKADKLILVKPTDLLTNEDQQFYLWAQKLVDDAGNVRDVVSRKLVEMHASSNPKEKLEAKKREEQFFRFASTDYFSIKEPSEAKKASASAPSRSSLSSKVPDMAFGKAKWEKYIGEVGEEPPLPADIDKILKDRCPFSFWPKRIEQTHMLVLIPETVNGKPLTLQYLGELVKNPKSNGNSTHFKHPKDTETFKKHCDKPVAKSHWVLMFKDLFPNTVDKLYSEQQTLVESFNRKNKKYQYHIVKVLEAATCNFMEHISTGTYLYHSAGIVFSSKYSRCQEEYEGHQLVLGSYNWHGLTLPSVFFLDGYYSKKSDYIGVGVTQELFPDLML